MKDQRDKAEESLVKKLGHFQRFMLKTPLENLRWANWPCIYIQTYVDKNEVLKARRCGQCRSCKGRLAETFKKRWATPISARKEAKG